MAYEKVANGLLSFKKKLQSQFNFENKKDRPFIVPTQFGLIFGTTVLLLLIMALGSANNVLYLFVFFLISVSLSAMILTNNNLEKIRITKIQAEPCFASENVNFKVTLKNFSAKSKYNLELQIQSQISSIAELQGFSEKNIILSGRGYARGVHQFPRAQLESRFPFELLRSWKNFNSENNFVDSFWVYPARNSRLPFPFVNELQQLNGEIALFKGLREFQTTDSPKRVDWRASAKHQEMLVKNFEAPVEKSFQFNWAQTENAKDFEARLSALATWIVQAEQSGACYSLSINNKHFNASKGSQHFHSCLKTLAYLQPEHLT